MSLDLKFKFSLFFFTTLISFNMLFSHPQGDDELVSIYIANELLIALKKFDFKEFFIILLQNYHPPGREFTLMAVFVFFEDTFLNARVVTIILYTFIILKIFELSKKLSNNLKISFFISIFLATTGLFQIQTMISIHGITTFISLLIVIKLLDIEVNKFISIKNFSYLITLSFVGFLFSNTFLLFSAPMYLILNYLLYKNKYNLKFILLINFFISLFYIIYFLIFLGIPYYLYYNNEINAPVGQLYKYFFRYDNSELSLKSFHENFKITNFYSLPFVFYFLSLIGTYSIFKNYKLIFLTLVIYFILFNFIITIHTGQHYLSFVILTYPFGILFLYKKLIFINKNIKYMLGVLFFSITLCWTFFFHIKSYNEIDYPDISKLNFFLDYKWLHNRKFPIDEIDLELSKIGQKKTLNLAGVEWSIYFKDRNFFYYKNHFFEKYNCKQILSLYENKLKAIIFKDQKITNCLNNLKEISIKNFSKSKIWLITKK